MAKQLPDDMGKHKAPRIPSKVSAEALSKREIAERGRARLERLALHELQSHPLQPADRHARSNLDDLVRSIGELGLQEPPLVWRQSDGAYVILAGHRRVHACRALFELGQGPGEIEVYMRSDLSKTQALYVMAAEYFHRREYAFDHVAELIGQTWKARSDELGRKVSSRDLVSVLPWEKSAIAAYRKVYEALHDEPLKPRVQRLDNPDISFLYKVLCLKDYATKTRVLDAFAERGITAARREMPRKKPRGRRPKPVRRTDQTDGGFTMTVQFRPEMTVDEVQQVLDALERARLDIVQQNGGK